MVSGGKLVWLVDDRRSSFWSELESDWQARIRQMDAEPMQVTQFQSVNAAYQEILDRLANTSDDADHYIVSDLMFHGDDRGGHELIRKIFDTRQLAGRVKRAVVYSQLVDSGVVEPDQFIHVKRRGHDRAEMHRIMDFLQRGVFVDVHSVLKLAEELRPIEYLCDALVRNEGPARGALLAPMSAYGVAKPNVGGFFFDPLLKMSSSSLLYTAESAYLFSGAARSAFSNALLYDANPDPTLQWNLIESVLSPWTSLRKPSGAPAAIRVLWEGVMLGLPSLPVAGHPLMNTPGLSAYERVWVRQNLQALAVTARGLTDPGALKHTCQYALEEINEVDATLRAAAAGYQWIEDGEL